MHPFLVILVVFLVGNLCYHLSVLVRRRLEESLPSIGLWCLVSLVNAWVFLRDAALRLNDAGHNTEKVKELRRHIKLPADANQWIARAKWLYANNEPIRIGVQVLVLYTFYLLTSHLWLPYFTYANMPPLQATQLELYDHTGTEIQPCVWANEQGNGLCFLHRSNALGTDVLVEIVGRDLVFTGHSAQNKTLDLLVLGDHLLYPLDFVVPSNSQGDETEGWFSPVRPPPDEDSKETVLMRRYVDTATDMVSLLMHLQHKEHSVTLRTEPCICALFLNILSNVTFLYDKTEQRWLVMANPVIYRNNSFAELVASSIGYNALSLFSTKHRRWRNLVPQEIIHYDSFVVEYTEPVASSLVEERKKVGHPYSEKLREAEFTKASLFYRTETAELVRKQVHISGDDAVCFTYCNALTRAYNEKNKKVT